MSLVLALVTAWLIAQAPAAPAQPLFAQIPVRASLAGGERASYTIDVPANYAARIVVRQEGVNITMRLARQGEAMPQPFIDFNSGTSGEERAYPPVLDRETRWEVRIGTGVPFAARAEYVIEAAVAPADAAARAIAAARWTFFEGQEALNNPDATGLRTGRDKFTAAAEQGRAIGDLSLEAEATFQAGRMFDQLGDQPESIRWQLRALELYRTLGQKDRESRVLNRLGNLARATGDVAESERYFALALPLAREARDPANVADVLNNAGLLLLATGRPEEAIAQLEGALPLARQVDSANVEGALLNNLGEAYRRLGMYDKAVAMSEQAQPVIARLASPRRSARNLFLMAGSLYEKGDIDKAGQTIAKSLAIYETSGDQQGYATARALQAQMLYASGETDRALATFADVRPLLQKSQNRLGEATMLASWADIDISRGLYNDALAKLDTAVSLSRAVANQYAETRSEYLRAVAYQKQDRLDDAVSSIRKVIDSVEAMRGSIARADLRTSYLAAVRSYYDLYVDLQLQRGQPAEAFEISERARARALLEGLAESAAKIDKGADAALVARQRQIQRALNAKETYRADLALRQGEQSAAARAVSAEVETLLEQWTAVRAQIRAASPSYAALQMPRPITVAELQRSLLDAGSAMIAFHLGESRSHAWVIDRDSVTVQALPPMKAIEPLARRYHEALSREVEGLTAPERDKVSAAARAAGRSLAAIVWTPIEARVAGRRLLVIADRALHYVPFAALPAASGVPIIARHEVVNLPSASVLATLRGDSRPVSLNAATAVFADPVFSTNDPRFAAARDASAPAQSRGSDGALYGRLRFSRREAEAIAERAPGSFQALDFAASKSALVSRNLRQYRVLHFATHGSLNTEHPELSGLVFSLVDRAGRSVDGFLRLHEIYNLDLDADLVVLSACRTALGREVHGEGLIGLTRGFMYAGASRVVSSVWNVDDRASALLMSRFYDAMRTRKRTPAAALREAQLSLLNDPRWANPHYWAAFGLQGDWQ